MARSLLKTPSRQVNPTSPNKGETAMKPLPSKKTLPATRTNAATYAEWDLDVTLPEAALCEFSGLMEEDLVKLVSHFKSFVTSRSKKRSSGR
jgi:hypothetical protein